MYRTDFASRALAVAVLVGLLAPGVARAQAIIPGETGTTFNLTASTGYITSADGGSLYTWGYGTGAEMQYPGPTLIVNEGDTVTVNLTNTLPVPTSIVFPGLEGVTATGGAAGSLTQESTGPGDVVTYTFTASNPGTYTYRSGTRPDLQVDMGLAGALIVRPAGYDAISNRTAYGHPDSRYDHEYMFMLSEMDHRIHEAAELAVTPADFAAIDTSNFRPTYWFVNGRTAPDTLFPSSYPLFPYQPYGSFVRGKPGDRILMRIIGMGNDMHPLHAHGENSTVIAQDGRLLASGPGAGADLAYSDFTISIVPGGTMDSIFQWTGEGMGWDIYGTGAGYEHGTCTSDQFNADDVVNNDTGMVTADGNGNGYADGDGFHDVTWEYCADHGKPFPVTLPGLLDLAFGGFYSGSPFLGHDDALPPGEGGLNFNGGYHFMWHSHNEKELANFDVFPGGMMTMFVLEPPGTPIP
ncbi:MAG: multicopper oxidase family protein [Alphaproteobacteria bacterium]|nr:multicopper oxidase family protein [Alphaproteobacteria bacterium]